MQNIGERLNIFLNQNQLKLTLIDVGARGTLQDIWKPLTSNLNVIGFEPDQDEYKKLVSRNSKNKYFNTALSNKREELTLFITKDPSCSSLFKSNLEYIRIFEPQNWESKITVSKQNIQCERLDALINYDVDYIKIDTQGFELNILKGAESLLVNQHPIVSCEAWCTEVYSNAPKFNEIINYMNSLGYEVFDLETAASWKYRTDKKVVSRKRKIGFEILFVKSYEKINVIDDKSLKRHLLILEYLGYRDYAIFLDSFFKLELDDYLYKNNKMLSEFLKGKLNTILYYLNKLNSFPSFR